MDLARVKVEERKRAEFLRWVRKGKADMVEGLSGGLQGEKRPMSEVSETVVWQNEKARGLAEMLGAGQLVASGSGERVDLRWGKACYRLNLRAIYMREGGENGRGTDKME